MKSKSITEFGFCRIMKSYPDLGGTLLDLRNSHKYSLDYEKAFLSLTLDSK